MAEPSIREWLLQPVRMRPAYPAQLSYWAPMVNS